MELNAIKPIEGFMNDMAQLRRIFVLVPWRMRGRVVGLLVASALSAVLDMAAVATMLPLTQMLTASGVAPAVVQRYVVPVLGTSDRSRVLLALALFVGLTFLVKNISVIIIRWKSIGVVTRANSAVQSRLLEMYVGSSYATHRGRSKGAILQAVTGAVPAAMNSVMLGYITLAVYGMTALLLFATLFVMSPVASILAIIIFGGASLLIARVLKPWALRSAVRALDLQTEAFNHLNPAIEGFRETRIFRKEDVFSGRYARNRTRAAGLAQAQQFLGELPKYLLEIVMIGGILVIALFLFGTQPQSTAFGLLAVFAAASVRIVPSLNLLVATYNGVLAGRPSLKMVSDEVASLEAEAAASSGNREQPVEIPRANIVVDSVGFHYPDSDVPVLSDVSVTIPVGATVALVGSSGAGKTTFADILAGLFVPTSGSVTVGGHDIAAHPRSWLAGVAMVSQKVYLWDATLRDLITFGQAREEVDDVLLADVLLRTRLDDFVASLPDGLDTMVGDSGARVSGGQAQRIGIARALYTQPKVLILDEATSALDNETENEITKTIEALHGEITVIVIAHRLSTVKNADEILFFSHGRLQSRGSMAELRRKDPEFARLVELGSIVADSEGALE